MSGAEAVIRSLEAAGVAEAPIECFRDALLEGRLEEARQIGGFVLPNDWPDEHDGRFLRFRLRQMGTTS